MCNCNGLKTNPCGCNETPKCEQNNCSCPVKDLSTDCVLYTGDDLECSGIKKGTILTELLQQLDEFICEKFNSVLSYFSLVNIGLGAKFYKGISLTGEKEIRTLVKEGDLISINELEDEVEITIDEDALVNLINIEEALESIGDEGVDVYKGYNQTTEKHEIRKIKSDSFEVVEDGDSVSINEVSIDDNQTFYVNNNYNGVVENGSISKPFKNIGNALSAVIGTGTTETPQFLGARVIVLPSTTIYAFNSNLFVRFLDFEVRQGARLLFNDSTKYMVDTRDVLNNPNFVSGEGYSMAIYNYGLVETLGGLVYGKGNGNISGSGVVVSLYGDGNFAQIFDVNNTINIPQTVGGTDFITLTTTPTLLQFYEGDPNQMPMIVCDDDNGDTSNVMIEQDGLTIIGTTQTLIEVKNKGYFFSFNNSLNMTLLVPFTHYGTTSGADGTPTVITPNSDFHFIRINSGAFNCKELNFNSQRALNNTYIYYSELVKLDTTLNETIIYGLSGGRIVSQNEFNHIVNIYGDTTNANVSITDTELQFGGSQASLADRYIVNSEDGGSLTTITFNRNVTDRPTDPQIDLTRGNIFSPVNVINNNQVFSYRKYPTRASAVAAGLIEGTSFINTNNNDADTATHFLDVII